MNTPALLAKHLREVYTGGNWTSVNLQQSLEGISVQMAGEKIGSINTIASLVFHINYYVEAQIRVMEGEPLDAHDKYSYDLPQLNSEQDWQQLKTRLFYNGEKLAVLTEQLPEEKLKEYFVEEKYGSYHRNLIGLLEHTHYHLGQIVIIKKFLKEKTLVLYITDANRQYTK